MLLKQASLQPLRTAKCFRTGLKSNLHLYFGDAVESLLKKLLQKWNIHAVMEKHSLLSAGLLFVLTAFHFDLALCCTLIWPFCCED